MTSANLTAAIKDRARALGFDLVGIAPVSSSLYSDAYTAWLEQGYAGDMAYLSRPDAVAKRRDPRLILPSVRSVIVVGINYYTEAAENGEWKIENREWKIEYEQDPRSSLHSPLSPLHSPTGVISRYAWGDDYHELIRERLEELAQFMREVAEGESQGKVYVDTGPLLEREWAARAGLGWFGKNTNLLHKKWGSWFFLGEILTSLELNHDQPSSAHCGTCTRCLAACPTGALVAPYVLDARRCISYLTIELKGPIPRHLRPLLGNLIFGCDLCQDACPWNLKHARSTEEPAFQPRPGLNAPELVPLLHLTSQEFNAKFKGSPIRRAKRRGLLRNVAVALGNSGDPVAIPALCQALQDPEPLIRGHAAWALGQLTPRARPALTEAWEKEEDAWVREEIRIAWG